MKTSVVYFANDAKQAVVVPSLWQWDYGQQIMVRGLSLPENYTVHIGFAGDAEFAEYPCRNTVITIPDKYLEVGKEILIFVCITNAEGSNTSYLIRCPVRKRVKPPKEE